MKGYKATDKDMKCRGYQFTMNEWHEHTGDLKMCESGFHFCVYPSGVWSFYNYEGTRVFEIEAEDLLDTPIEAGSAVKKVCRRIRFVKEIFPDGNRNTGYGNCCDRSSGHFNTVTPPLIMFDLPTDQEPDSDLVYSLSCKLAEDEEFDCAPYLSLPNATEEKIKALHKKHIEKRKSEVKR